MPRPSHTPASAAPGGSGRRLLAATCFLLAAFSALAAEATRDFNVPAGTARETLKRFAAQAQVEVLFPSEKTLGVQTNAVAGRFTPQQALAALLADTGLRADRDAKSGAFAIRPETPVPKAVAARTEPAPTTRAASAPPPRTEVQTSDVVALSPFEVTTGKDTGYAALETLAGTRIRTDLHKLGRRSPC